MQKINPECYITFEPGILEHSAIKLNAPDGVHNQFGLSDNIGSMRFYVNEEEADPSLVKPSNYTHHIDIKTTTLTHYIKVNKIKKLSYLNWRLKV